MRLDKPAEWLSRWGGKRSVAAVAELTGLSFVRLEWSWTLATGSREIRRLRFEVECRLAVRISCTGRGVIAEIQRLRWPTEAAMREREFQSCLSATPVTLRPRLSLIIHPSPLHHFVTL